LLAPFFAPSLFHAQTLLLLFDSFFHSGATAAAQDGSFVFPPLRRLSSRPHLFFFQDPRAARSPPQPDSPRRVFVLPFLAPTIFIRLPPTSPFYPPAHPLFFAGLRAPLSQRRHHFGPFFFSCAFIIMFFSSDFSFRSSEPDPAFFINPVAVENFCGVPDFELFFPPFWRGFVRLERRFD